MFKLIAYYSCVCAILFRIFVTTTSKYTKKMEASNFKSKASELKDFLKGKKIVMTLVTESNTEKVVFTSLKSFGNKILELEELGFGFGFDTVGNEFVNRDIKSEANLNKWISRGVWNKITITASNLKF